MEKIIFIAAWIITGIIANIMVFNKLRDTVAYNSSQDDVELSKKEAEEIVMETLEPTFSDKELEKPETKLSTILLALLKWLVITAVGIAIWPVIVPIALYTINHRIG